MTFKFFEMTWGDRENSTRHAHTHTEREREREREKEEKGRCGKSTLFLCLFAFLSRLTDRQPHTQLLLATQTNCSHDFDLPDLVSQRPVSFVISRVSPLIPNFTLRHRECV